MIPEKRGKWILSHIEKAKEEAGDEKIKEILSAAIDRKMLLNTLNSSEAEDFFAKCSGIIERNMYSKESAIGLMELAKVFVNKLTGNGFLMGQFGLKTDYDKVIGHLNSIKKELKKENKEEVSQEKLQEYAGLALGLLTLISEALLQHKSIPRETRVEMQNLKVAVTAIRLRMPKTR